jgi:hypothetical protein
MSKLLRVSRCVGKENEFCSWVLTLQPDICQTSRVHSYALGCLVAVLAIPYSVFELPLPIVRLVIDRALGGHCLVRISQSKRSDFGRRSVVSKGRVRYRLDLFHPNRLESSDHSILFSLET